MKHLTLIGIGTGNPEHVTLAGVTAMRSVDCVLLPRKEGKDDLAEIRRDLVRVHAPDTPVIEFDMPVRDTSRPYLDGVDDWHDRIVAEWRLSLPSAASSVALLVWGDPSLYDSTLRIAARLTPAPTVHVVPGITALQALTAAHAIPLNDINASVLLTTGRQLRDHGWPASADRIAVMLDGECSFQSIDPTNVTIWWGAFLGMPQQILMHGALADIGTEIVTARQSARERHGWLMDTYMMQR